LQAPVLQQNAELLQIIRQQVVAGLPMVLEEPVRKTLGTIVTQLVSSTGVWPELLVSLSGGLDSADQNVIDLNMDCLEKIAEDAPEKLAEAPPGQQSALDVIVPRMIAFMRNPHAPFREKSLSFMNNLLLMWPAALNNNLQGFLEALFSLGQDTSSTVRKRCYMGVVSISEDHKSVLAAHLRNVIQFMVNGSQDQDEEVAKEATEFWTVLADSTNNDQEAFNVFKEFLPTIIPMLLKNMAYSIHDDVDEGDDETVPDKPEDLRPRNYHGKDGGDGDAGDDDDDDDEDDDDDGDDEDVSIWNLRKCSAAGLDTISNTYHDDILQIVLPLVKQMLVDPNWRYREAGILALGAISEGCRLGMEPFLDELFPFLFQCLKDTQPLVRSITCWTLGRYTSWVVDKREPAKYLEPLMTELLQRVLDTNKKVQDAACSAFATLEEEAQGELIPYLGPIVQNLMFAFGKYQAKNLNILYDTIGTLADSVGRAMANKELVQAIMIPIMQKLATMDDVDRNMYPVLECLASITTAVGIEFQDYAMAVWQRCQSIIHTTIVKLKAGENVEKELIVCSLDLLSAICEGIQGGVESLVAQSQVLQLLSECLQDPQHDIKQSAFALIGDLSKNCIQHLAPYLPQYLPVLCQHLKLEQSQFPNKGRRQNPMVSVCNNACWAIGELTMKVGADIQPYAPHVMPCLVENIQCENLNPSLLQNTAITIGRFALVCPNLLAPGLETFAIRWCYRMARMRDDLEKNHACRGLCNLIQVNPQGIIKAFVPLLLVIASWEPQSTPPDLKTMFAQIIEAFVQNLGQPLATYLNNPKVLEPLNGVQGVEQGIGWDPKWHKRNWDVAHLAQALVDRQYKVN